MRRCKPCPHQLELRLLRSQLAEVMQQRDEAREALWETHHKLRAAS